MSQVQFRIVEEMKSKLECWKDHDGNDISVSFTYECEEDCSLLVTTTQI